MTLGHRRLDCFKSPGTELKKVSYLLRQNSGMGMKAHIATKEIHFKVRLLIQYCHVVHVY
jgi:hypothetical protein